MSFVNAHQLNDNFKTICMYFIMYIFILQRYTKGMKLIFDKNIFPSYKKTQPKLITFLFPVNFPGMIKIVVITKPHGGLKPNDRRNAIARLVNLLFKLCKEYFIENFFSK